MTFKCLLSNVKFELAKSRKRQRQLHVALAFVSLKQGVNEVGFHK